MTHDVLLGAFDFSYKVSVIAIPTVPVSSGAHMLEIKYAEQHITRNNVCLFWLNFCQKKPKLQQWTKTVAYIY